MMNQIILVGRLVKDPIVEGQDRKVGIITLAIPRSFKNAEGMYDTDFVDCKIFDSIATNTSEYCKKGDLVGVKGRLQSTTEDDGDGHFTRKIEIIAEKITFLKSRDYDKNA